MQPSRRQFLKKIGLSSLGFALLACGHKQAHARPSIIFIMIDDLGYGDLGCYGSRFNRTPNIDQLANDGILFTDYHSNGPMCTPTRAALITGKYQHRFGRKFEGAISGKTDYDDGLPLDAFTIAEALKQTGYATGMYGKWHLGYHPPLLPANQGFDEFIGLGSGDGDHHTHIDRLGREDWWRNNQLEMEAGYSTNLITSHSIDFIKAHQQEPFFLYVAHLSIHFPWQGPTDPPHRVKGIDYANDKWGIIPDRNNIRPHVKAMIESIDRGVGKIIRTLKELHLDENTLVVITSDNGGYIHYSDSHFNISSNGPLRGQKTEVYEGGHRVPFIACLPGKLQAGARSDALVMTMDMFPTFLEFAGSEPPPGLSLDGISILPHLFRQQALPERAVCWKIDDHRAIRKGKWKLCLIEERSPELYNLSTDLAEMRNLAPENPELVSRLTAEYFAWEKDVTSNY
ncbi:sulfatase [candidate division KSB1 bacterium]|nr:sulfatase [candidate division KSB1 bacterium]